MSMQKDAHLRVQKKVMHRLFAVKRCAACTRMHTNEKKID